ncbi:MAG: phosphatidate cytidylyltransferase [Mariprofundaceae bacterium]|nr:phosphatidate cytidylyltransferase [Mariprofundaceae bacterium]
MNELQQRIITGSCLFLFALIWLFLVPESLFVMFLVALGLLASYELLQLLGYARSLGFVVVTVLAWAGLLIKIPLPAVLLFAAMGWSFCTIFSVRESAQLPAMLTRLAWLQWMMVWLLLFAWSMAEMHGRVDGLWLLAGSCAGVWGADIAAYFTGKRLGKHKLCPAVSPGKTIEGVAGGLLFGVLAAASIWTWSLDVSWWQSTSLAVILVACAVLGDLNESALKRTIGVKDSGSILPGHGGILDRIDALLPAIPMVALLSPWWLGV